MIQIIKKNKKQKKTEKNRKKQKKTEKKQKKTENNLQFKDKLYII